MLGGGDVVTGCVMSGMCRGFFIETDVAFVRLGWHMRVKWLLVNLIYAARFWCIIMLAWLAVSCEFSCSVEAFDSCIPITMDGRLVRWIEVDEGGTLTVYCDVIINKEG
jgi:hypothetical protein